MSKRATTEFGCPWCGGKARVTSRAGFVWEAPRDTTPASAAELANQASTLGVDDARGDAVITGLTVVGGYGWAPPAGTRVTVGVSSHQLVVLAVPFAEPAIQIPYERITAFDFQGGATTEGGGFIGGGFGLEGAAVGMIAASVLNALTTKSQVNSLVRISATGGEVYLHHGGLLPDQLRTLFGPAVNEARSGRAGTDPKQADPIDRLAKLARLRDDGVLTEQEFEAAKSKILGELT